MRKTKQREEGGRERASEKEIYTKSNKYRAKNTIKGSERSTKRQKMTAEKVGSDA